jgi:hypothetical protein
LVLLAGWAAGEEPEGRPLLTEGSAAALVTDSPVETDRFREGVKLFTDRTYTAPAPPEGLDGLAIVRAAIDGHPYRCVRPGVLYALTPSQQRTGAASQEIALVEHGFRKVALPEFQLFGGNAIDIVSVYQKQVAEGERLEFGKWVVLLGRPGLAVSLEEPKPWSENDGELLVNGIRLPSAWPPRNMVRDSREPMPVPYLQWRPEVVPIDVGRQLLVDDFLIESTNLKRTFHQPAKYVGNPVLKPEMDHEMCEGHCPNAAPFSDGVFFDPADALFKMWYQAGWFDGVALATSRDGLRWKRPELNVVPGTNRVLAPRDDLRRDGVSIWLDHDAKEPAERYKMYFFARQGKIGQPLRGGTSFLLTSPDGIDWTWRGEIGGTSDNNTFFYNPFRKVWVFSVRHGSRFGGRARSYWESHEFLAPLGGWGTPGPVFWLGADKFDEPHPAIGNTPQLYKVDAVAYESLMLGLLQPHYGPENGECAKGGFPKLTELQVAFSRDGFHWDRSARETFIGATMKRDSWERAYIHSAGGVCLVVGDKLYFYYGAFQGDESNRNPNGHWNGMYANASTGLAILRRDGFASLNADAAGGALTTRLVTFRSKHLFVNVDCPEGDLRVEVLDRDGNVIEPFSAANCRPVSTDSTLVAVTWEGGSDLASLAGQPVRFRFALTNGRLYAFWVSPDATGASHGYVAAGGPGFTGPIDTVGKGP